MKIEVDPNTFYCENGQWKVHLGSVYDVCRDKMAVIEKAILPDCNCGKTRELLIKAVNMADGHDKKSPEWIADKIMAEDLT